MNRVEYLYLLIGTNPLSNYVVADYFLQNEPALKEIHLVHSSEDLENKIVSTELYALNLKHVLEKQSDCVQFICHGISIKDSRAIRTGLTGFLKTAAFNESKNGRTDQNIHLDYSGGTKEMAMHSYEIFKEYFGRSVSFSYFDSRRNVLKYDFGNRDEMDGENEDAIFVDLRSKVEIDFENLFLLHGYQRETIEKKEIFTVDYFRNFLLLLQDSENFCNYLKWREFFLKTYVKNQKNIPANGLQKLDELLPPEFAISPRLKDELLLKIHDASPEISFIEEIGGEWYLRTEISNKQSDKLDETRKYIIGKWFEQYIYLILKENFYDTGFVSSVDLNLFIQTDKKNFEIDAAVIKGYELCGISCTTDKTQSLCKSKGFEILHRTKQIAGNNSKAILMTFMNEENTKELDADLSEILDDRILVFGRADLFSKEEFCRKIRDFLQS